MRKCALQAPRSGRTSRRRGDGEENAVTPTEQACKGIQLNDLREIRPGLRQRMPIGPPVAHYRFVMSRTPSGTTQQPHFGGAISCYAQFSWQQWSLSVPGLRRRRRPDIVIGTTDTITDTGTDRDTAPTTTDTVRGGRGTTIRGTTTTTRRPSFRTGTTITSYRVTITGITPGTGTTEPRDRRCQRVDS